MNIGPGRRGRERPRREMPWEQVDRKVLYSCGEPAISSFYSVLVWVRHSGAALRVVVKVHLLGRLSNRILGLYLALLALFQGGTHAASLRPTALKNMLVSCVDRTDISHRNIVKLGTATVLMCMIYLLLAARYHALFVP